MSYRIFQGIAFQNLNIQRIIFEDIFEVWLDINLIEICIISTKVNWIPINHIFDQSN